MLGIDFERRLLKNSGLIFDGRYLVAFLSRIHIKSSSQPNAQLKQRRFMNINIGMFTE